MTEEANVAINIAEIRAANRPSAKVMVSSSANALLQRAAFHVVYC